MFSIQQAPRISLSVNQSLTRSPVDSADKRRQAARAAHGWQMRRYTLAELAKHLDTGAAIGAVYERGHRSDQTTTGAQVIAVDLDERGDLDQLEAFLSQHDLFSRRAWIIGATPSSRPDKPRARVFFPLAELVTGEALKTFSSRCERVLAQFAAYRPDNTSTSVSRFYFGFQTGTTRAHAGDCLTLAELDELPAPEREARPAPARPARPAVALNERALQWHDDNMQRISDAAQGEQNKQLFYWTVRSAELAAGGAFSDDKLRTDAYAAALAGGYVARDGEHQTRATIESAIREGLKNPRKARHTDKPARLPETAPSAQETPAASVDQVKTVFSAWGAATLPDSWRSAMLNYLPAAAPTLELVNEAARAALLDPERFTLPELKAANERLGFKIAESTLDRQIRKAGEFFSLLHTHEAVFTVCKSEKNSAGRKAAHYCVLPVAAAKQFIVRCAAPRLYEKYHPIEPRDAERPILARPTASMMRELGYNDIESVELAAQLDKVLAPAYQQQGNAQERGRYRAKRDLDQLTRDLEDSHSSTLPAGWPLATVADYRAAFLRATYSPDTESRSRRELAELVGAAPRSVDSILERAGMESFKQPLVERPLRVLDNTVEQEVRKLAQEVKGFPLRLVTREPGRVVEQTYSTGAARAVLSAAVQTGATVYVQFQVANRQELVSDAPPVKATPTHTHNASPSAGGALSAPEREAAPAAVYGPRYNPLWILAQLRLALLLLTGEIAEQDATPVELVEAILGRDQQTTSTQDSAALLLAAIELGATVYRRTG